MTKTQEFLDLKSKVAELPLERLVKLVPTADTNTEEAIELVVLRCTQALSKLPYEEAIARIEDRPLASPAQQLLTQIIALRGDGPGGVLARINTVLFPKDSQGRLVRSKLFTQEFTFLTREGRQYKSKLIYCRASQKTTQELLDKNLLAPTEKQVELVEKFRANPELFTVGFVRKPSNQGKNYFTMAAIQPVGEKT